MGKMSTMRQCECGAYRLAKKVDGEWTWVAGCRACDKIARLYVLLDGGVKVTTKESPSRLREKLVRAEDEADRLKSDIEAMTTRYREELAIARDVCPMSGGAMELSCNEGDDDEEGESTSLDQRWN